jgi:hypothetical protein
MELARWLVSAVMALACGACATESVQNGEPREEKIYRTGSNIPIHDRTQSPAVDVDPRSVNDATMRRTMPTPTPGMRGG